MANVVDKIPLDTLENARNTQQVRQHFGDFGCDQTYSGIVDILKVLSCWCCAIKSKTDLVRSHWLICHSVTNIKVYHLWNKRNLVWSWMVLRSTLMLNIIMAVCSKLRPDSLPDSPWLAQVLVSTRVELDWFFLKVNYSGIILIRNELFGNYKENGIKIIPHSSSRLIHYSIRSWLNDVPSITPCSHKLCFFSSLSSNIHSSLVEQLFQR